MRNGWVNEVELRRVEVSDDEFRVGAFRTKGDYREIPIPKPPKPHTNLQDWLDGLDLFGLEAARQYYWDHWTWEDGLPQYKDLAQAIDREINRRIESMARLHASRFPQAQQGRTTFDLEKIRQQQDRAHGDL